VLADDAGFVFPRREITRPADAGGEDHIAVSAADFALRRDGGGYALWWEAHGLSYGVPVRIDAALATGATVVVNISRTVIDAARRRFPRLRIVHIAAPLPVLAQRIAARGREDPADVAKRLARAGDGAPSGPDVVEICNDGRLEDAVAAFLAAIRG
jgi:phosphonate metabolism protein PhnN/1,5-bisphosphokinase (PRPP-forming)